MVAPVRRSNKLLAAIFGRLRQHRPFISRAVRRRSNNKSKQRNNASSSSVLFSRRYASTALIVIVLQCLLISLFVYNPNWVQDFLNGPRIAYKPSPILKEYNQIPNNNYEDNTKQQQQNYYRRPEDPIPIRDNIFTALTRKERKQIKHQKKMYEELKESNKLISCQLDNGDCEHQINNNPTKSSSSWQNLFSFRGSSSSSLSSSSSKVSLIIYNPLPESRYFCGNKIQGGGGTIELTEFPPSSASCPTSQYSYLYSPHPPPLNGKKKGQQQQPIELYWNAMDDPSFYYDSNEELAAVTTKKFKNCPIPCRTNGEFNILSTINVRDTKWEITMTMEGEDYYGEAHYRKKNYVNDRYYATTSFRSEIPVPYFSWAEYKINHTPPVNFDKAIKGASFLANNCDSMSKREDLVRGLLKTTKLRVDSLSSCFHNAEVPVGVNIENKTQVLEQYLFHLAFENQRTNDYITEKLWGTLAAGTIPVYFGAPNIKDHVPPNSVIFVDDYQTTQELADYLIKLTKDRALYESYHKWRYEDMDTNFMDKYRFTDTHSTCRICKWAYAKKHGLEWNHSAQEIQEPYIAHKTCRNKHGFISWPFKEFWLPPPSSAAAADGGGGKSSIKVITGEDDVGIKTCDLDDNNRLIRIGTGGEEGGIFFQRRVYDQDGVTDLVIDEVVSDSQHQQQVEKVYILKLETPIMSDELLEKQRGKEYWLQDSQSRMTLLSNRNVTVTTTTTTAGQQQQQGGTTASVQIVITRSIRIRVIMENIDTFHKKATTRENYFGELMKRDFFNPLQAYRVVQT